MVLRTWRWGIGEKKEKLNQEKRKHCWLSANAPTNSSDWRCSRASEEDVSRSQGDMGADPDARSPDLRVPDGVKGNDGLREGEEEEEESLDATDARRRTEEPEDAASEH
ncbi:hypothetical protein NDU88_004918 [Pleurodeles waltl]|uniref:Uncharacterized protein n=1 Tax=Pleurodeles waltl TaxID=8319 RepID=A0AAV7MUV8_PLEWA|nr:hypothetical protein NDU88_004918 [Pleurodeles waltl]